MRFIPAKTPFLIKAFFKNYIWNIAPTINENTLYLTFDDGPTPDITEWTLDVLKSFSAKATFFCIGANTKKHPEIFKRIIDEGHAIGNHTQNHLKGWKTKAPDYLDDIKRCQQELNSSVLNPKSQKPNLFRPPYGQITPQQGTAIKALGYKIVMWSVLSFDWEQTTSKERCYSNVIKSSKNGSIIVFHDSVKASRNMKYALPKVLDYYSEKGFLFKQIPE